MSIMKAIDSVNARGSAGILGARRVTVAATFVLVILGSAQLGGGAAADNAMVRLPLGLGSGSVLWLEGKSTIHDFESKTTQATVSLSRESGGAPAADAAGLDALIRSAGIRGFDLEVPVLSLKSDKSGLDRNLWRYLKSE